MKSGYFSLKSSLLLPPLLAVPVLVMLAASPRLPAAETTSWPAMNEALQPLLEQAAQQNIRLAIGVQRLDESGSRILLGSDGSYHPASTIKMLLIAALMRQVDEGRLSLSDTATVSADDIVGGYGELQNEPVPQKVSLARLAELTVTISDNTATNVLVDAVGYDAMRALAEELHLEVMHFGRKMFEEARPPEHDNYIDAADTLILLAAIYQHGLLSEESRQQVLDWMRAQTVRTKIAAGVPEQTPIAHKTGENGPVSHDIGYILLPGSEVAVAILAEAGDTSDFDTAQALLNPVVAQVAGTVVEALSHP